MKFKLFMQKKEIIMHSAHLSEGFARKSLSRETCDVHILIYFDSYFCDSSTMVGFVHLNNIILKDFAMRA